MNSMHVPLFALLIWISSPTPVTALKPLITFTSRETAGTTEAKSQDAPELWVPEIVSTVGTMALNAALTVSDRLVQLRFPMHLDDNVLSGPCQSLVLEALMWTVLYTAYATYATRRLAQWLPRAFPVFWNNNPHPSTLVPMNHHQGLVCSTVQDDAVVLLTWAGYTAVASTLCFWGWLLWDEIPTAHQLWRHGVLMVVGLWLSNLVAMASGRTSKLLSRNDNNPRMYPVLLYHPFRPRPNDQLDPLKPSARTVLVLHHVLGLVVMGCILTDNRKALQVNGLVLLLWMVATIVHAGYVYAHFWQSTRGPNKQGTAQTIYVANLGLWTMVQFGIVFRRILAVMDKTVWQQEPQQQFIVAASLLAVWWTVVNGMVFWDRLQEALRFWDSNFGIGSHDDDLHDTDDLSMSDDEGENNQDLDHRSTLDDDHDDDDSWRLDASTKKKRRSAMTLLLDLANTVTLRRRSSCSEILNCSQTSFETEEQQYHRDCCDPKGIIDPPVSAEDQDPLRITLSAYQRFRAKKEKSQ